MGGDYEMSYYRNVSVTNAQVLKFNLDGSVYYSITGKNSKGQGQVIEKTLVFDNVKHQWKDM